MPYLTGEPPDGACQVSITIPNDRAIRLAVRGALTELGFPWLWEAYGSVTPDDTAAAMLAAIQSLDFLCMTGGIDLLVMAHRTGTLGLGTNTYAKITGLSVVSYDSGQWDALNDRVVIDQDGLYLTQFVVGDSSTPAGISPAFYVNGSLVCELGFVENAARPGRLVPAIAWPLLDGDYVEMWCYASGSEIAAANFSAGLGLLVWRLGDLS